MNSDVDKLWRMVQRSFNRTNEIFEMPAIIGAIPASKEVQSRLLASIASLNTKKYVDEAVFAAIRADLLVSSAAGWMAADTAETARELLDRIEDARRA